jgi:hypothetical protein
MFGSVARNARQRGLRKTKVPEHSHPDAAACEAYGSIRMFSLNIVEMRKFSTFSALTPVSR